MEPADGVWSSWVQEDKELLAAAHLQCVQICRGAQAFGRNIPNSREVTNAIFPHIHTLTSHAHLWFRKNTHFSTSSSVWKDCLLTSIIPIAHKQYRPHTVPWMAAGCWATVCFAYRHGVCLASCILRSNRAQWPRLQRGSANKRTAQRKHKLSVGNMRHSDDVHAAYRLA